MVLSFCSAHRQQILTISVTIFLVYVVHTWFDPCLPPLLSFAAVRPRAPYPKLSPSSKDQFEFPLDHAWVNSTPISLLCGTVFESPLLQQGHHGAYEWKDKTPAERFYIMYRFHPEPWPITRFLPFLSPEHHAWIRVAGLMSFLHSLASMNQVQQEATTVTFLFNGAEHTARGQQRWKEFVVNRLGPFVSWKWIHVDISNYGSFLAQCDLSQTIAEPNAVVLWLEADYINLPSMLTELVEFFSSHEPCIVAPYDYRDRYYNLNVATEQPVHLVHGKDRHWRTVTSVTVTYAARAGVLQSLLSTFAKQPKNAEEVVPSKVDRFYQRNSPNSSTTLQHLSILSFGQSSNVTTLPNPKNDHGSAQALVRNHGISIWVPVPTLSSHLHTLDRPSLFTSAYMDVMSIVKQLANQARIEGAPMTE